MSRKVVVASTASNTAKRIETSATTRGELVASGLLDGLVSGEVEYIVNPGKIILGYDDSVLPEGDFQLFIIPKKNKAGMDYSEVASAVADAITKAVTIADKERVEELKNDLIGTIEDHFDVDLSADDTSSSEDDAELIAAMEAARQF